MHNQFCRSLLWSTKFFYICICSLVQAPNLQLYIFLLKSTSILQLTMKEQLIVSTHLLLNVGLLSADILVYSKFEIAYLTSCLSNKLVTFFFVLKCITSVLTPTLINHIYIYFWMLEHSQQMSQYTITWDSILAVLFKH